MKKRGKLSTEEERFIQDNVSQLEPSQIAIQLNRNERTIQKYIDNKGLAYKGMSQEAQEDAVLADSLINRPYWKQVKKQFTDIELSYFKTTWIKVMKQFKEDVLYTEELQIKQWITLEILSNRNMRDRKLAIEQTERLENLLREEYNKSTSERDSNKISNLEAELSQARGAIGSYTGEHSKLLEKIEKITKQLKAAREDRIKKIEDSKSTFAGLIRALEDAELREKFGEEAEIMRMAKDKAKEQLSQYHQYQDGAVDQPLLNHETLKDEE